MEENFKLENCSKNDALEFYTGAYRAIKIVESIKSVFSYELVEHLAEQLKTKNIHIQPSHCWFDKGMNCEIIRVGYTSWKKGRVRLKVSLEFISDEPEEIETESPLDDIRKTINK